MSRKPDIDSLKRGLDAQVSGNYLRSYTLRDDGRWYIEPTHSSIGVDVLTSAEVKAFIMGMRVVQVEHEHRARAAAEQARQEQAWQ